MENICSKCTYWEECLQYRYDNIKLKRMEKIEQIENKDGNLIIYVEKCNKFENRRPFAQSFLKKDLTNAKKSSTL